MAESLLLLRVDAIRRLARRGATSALSKVVARTRPEDLAAAMDHLAPNEQRVVFGQLGDDRVAASVLTHVNPAHLGVLMEDLPAERLVALFDVMPADDRADVLERLPEERRQLLLDRFGGARRAEVEELLGYPADSAGGLMSPLAVRLHEDTTCREAVAAVQQAIDHEMIYYIYVQNEAGQLSGTTSLRALLTHPPATRLSTFMNPDVISVPPTMDQEEVARIAGRYDMLAVPVVDEARRLLGIITMDDLLDVVRDEAAEDMMLMAGAGAAAEAGSVLQTVRRRLPWLGVALVGGIATVALLRLFAGGVVPWLAANAHLLVGMDTRILAREVEILVGVPLVLALGRHMGTLSATLVVRSLVGGRGIGGWRRVGAESAVSLLLGGGVAVVVAGCGTLFDGSLRVALGMAFAILGAMIGASAVGALVPLALRRVSLDPAGATGPLVQALVDLIGLALYLWLSILFMGPL